MAIDIQVSESDRQRPAVLCLSSQQFVRDVKELQKRSTKYAWLLLPGLTHEQKSMLPERLRVQSYYVNESGPDVDAAWARAKALGIDIITRLRNDGVNLIAVMGANWDYWEDEGMRLACDELGLPFLVLLREHDLRGNQIQLANEYFGPLQRIPEVTAVACAGQQSVDLFTATNLVPREKLRVTGWPRLDIWRAPVQPASDRPIVLMSYFKGYGADQAFVEMMHTFSDMSHEHAHIPFFVKAKHLGELQVLEQIKQKRGLRPEVIDTENLPALLSNARAVIGFHSAAMYEALLAPTRILIPKWGETDQDPHTLAPSPADPLLQGHMEFPLTEERLRRAVAESAISGPYPADMAARTRVFGAYFAYDLGRTAVQRVEDFVAEFTGT